MGTTLQLALKYLIEHTTQVRGEAYGILCATIMLELWHEAIGKSNYAEIMDTAITHAHRELREYEKHSETIHTAIEEALDSADFDQYESEKENPDSRDVALSKIRSYMNALQSEDCQG